MERSPHRARRPAPLVLDIAMNPEEFYGRTCMIFWREVTFERSGPESWEFLEMIEVTSIEILDYFYHLKRG